MKNPFIKFRNNLVRNGLEYFGLYYSLYEGIVTSNDDPENRLRVKVKCPAVYGNKEFPKWILPYGIFSGNKMGFYAVPPVGSLVWISFRAGNAEFPLWTYGWYAQDQSPEGSEPDVYQMVTPLGYKLEFNEKEETVKLFFDDDRELLFEKDTTTLKSGNNFIKLGNKISIDFSGVSMVDYLETLTKNIINLITIGSPTTQTLDPATKTLLNQSILELKKFME